MSKTTERFVVTKTTYRGVVAIWDREINFYRMNGQSHFGPSDGGRKGAQRVADELNEQERRVQSPETQPVQVAL